MLLGFYALLVIRNAWISDDGIITFRVVENFLAGYGLGYNPYVRVQAFTHPLWMFLIALVYFVSGLLLPSLPNALFHTTFIISILLSLTTVYLLLTRISSPGVLIMGLVTLLLSLSNGFIDFSTSGLENPLTHFLLVVFVIAFLKEKPEPLTLSFISALLLLNRMDAFLMTAPALVYTWWGSAARAKVIGRFALGFLPFLLWELFSLFYFGFAFPNTAYAKLNTGISQNLLILQGVDYYLNAFNWDPVTIFGLLLAGFALYAAPEKKFFALFGGTVFYLVYIVWIGGDFFASRFFSAPLLLSVSITAALLGERTHQWLALAAVVLLGVFSLRSPLWSSNMVAYLPSFPISDRNAISDQRLEYFGNERKGQFNSLVENGFREYDWGSNYAGDRWQFSAVEDVYVADALGKPGYKKGPNVFVIDNYALADPLLARLPALPGWEIGHFTRQIPEGYLDTLKTGENQIKDPSLAAYYDQLQYIVSGPLFDWGRIGAIWKFNTGQYDGLLNSYLGRQN